MSSDEFFGRSIAAREIGDYRMSLRAYGEHTRLPPHTHVLPFATIVVNGGFREESAGNTVDCGTHDVIVHAPEARHRNQFAGRETRCLSVQGGSFRRTACLTSSAAAAIALKLIGEFRHPDAFSPIVVDALMLELFVATERQSDTGAPRWLEKVRAIIDAQFQEPLTLAGLAEAVEVHPGHLARSFRQHFGTTIGDVLRDRRLTYARQRLQSDDPLQAIAHDAGFADQSHFTRSFRRKTGMTPSVYRRTLRAF